MDNLPETLICLINSVVEQYNEFAWSSQEKDGKMRITMTWTNEEFKRRKSKSAILRDKKRRDEFLLQKQKMDIQVDDNNDKESENESDGETTEDECHSNTEMDTADNLKTLCDAPLQVNIQPVLNRSIKRTIESRPVVDNQPCKKMNTVTIVNKENDDVNISKVNSIESVNEQKTQNVEKRRRRTWPRRYFRKIVMKTTSGMANTLIGIIPDRQVLIVHRITEKETEIITPGDREYRTYHKNVTEDFNDVKDTDFIQLMEHDVRNGIRLMEIFVRDNIVNK